MIYRFRRDWLVVLLTLVVVAITIYVMFDVYFMKDDMVDRIVAPIVFAVIYTLALRTPRYFYIEKDLIIVKFFLGSKVLEGIRSVRPIGKAELKRCARTFGNGGLMGYTGYFRSKELGDFQMLAVRKDELALVTLDSGKQYVINYPGELLDKSKEQ